MIDIQQWRVSIGSWACRQMSVHTHIQETQTTDNRSRIDGVSTVRKIRDLTFSLGLFLLLLLILSGDIELNPGPETELTSSNALRLLVKSGFDVEDKWTKLTSLLCVSLEERKRLKTQVSSDQDFYFALEEGLQWWITNGIAPSWKELISVVEICGDTDVATKLRQQLNITNEEKDNVNDGHLSDPQLSITNEDEELGDDRLYSDPQVANHALRTNYVNIKEACLDLHLLTDKLLSVNIISENDKRNLTDELTGKTTADRIGTLLDKIRATVRNNGKVFAEFIRILKEGSRRENDLAEILISSYKDFQSKIDKSSPNDLLPLAVQEYRDIIIDHYKDKPIVTMDWLPRVRKGFFGRLILLNEVSSCTTKTEEKKLNYMLRGEVDKLPYVLQDKWKEVDIMEVLKPNDGGQSLRIVVEGPPGIGKTTLCRKILNMWALGELAQYDLILYCPLRENDVALASNLQELLRYAYDCNEVAAVNNWFQTTHGHGLLLIFDGWDELSKECRTFSPVKKIVSGEKSSKCSVTFSLVKKILLRNKLSKCSVIVTSRSYASSSLLKLDTISKHIEVMGFFKDEIETAIKETLDQELAEKLIQDLETRRDVHSLCYVPLVCSMVVTVYKDDRKLPTTLTELYEYFIIQTIKRHVQNKSTAYIIEADEIDVLEHLSTEKELAGAFKQLCEFAYRQLNAEDYPKMSFSKFDVKKHLDQSEDDNYFGLMTAFTYGSNTSYQFLHLSIQEFLAAWWIAKYEKTEVLFAEHFHSEHFKKCLTFVAGLTHLRHESYQQYFNKEIDLQCKRRPLFGYEALYHSHFGDDSSRDIRPHIIHEYPLKLSSDKLNFRLLHLLYESQNPELCHTFSQSMKNQSLCLHEENRLSLFDVLCLGYFLKNSNITWNCLDLGDIHERRVQLLTSLKDVSHMRLQGKLIRVFSTTKNRFKMFQKSYYFKFHEISNPLAIKEVEQSSFYQNLQECYITFQATYTGNLQYVVPVLLKLLKLENLRILHFKRIVVETFAMKGERFEFGLQTSDEPMSDPGIFGDLEESLCSNTTLYELDVFIGNGYSGSPNIPLVVNSVIKGVTKNKSIQCFSITVSSLEMIIIDNEEIKVLLKDNRTLNTFKLKFEKFARFSSFLDIEDLPTQLTSLDISGSCKLLIGDLQNLEKLQRLSLHDPGTFPHPNSFYLNHNLQYLDLTIYNTNIHDTAEYIAAIFTVLQTNTTLKVLRLKMTTKKDFTKIGPSLQRMLKENKTLQYLEIICHYPNTFMPFLTTGLPHNTSLQGLSLAVPLSATSTNYRGTMEFFSAFAHKNDLTELKVNFILDEKYDPLLDIEKTQKLFCVTKGVRDTENEETKQVMTMLFHEQGLRFITKILKFHTHLRLLQVTGLINISHDDDWKTPAQYFWQSIFSHPSLQYIGITQSPVLEDTLKSQEKILIDMHKQLQPQKQLPLIEWVADDNRVYLINEISKKW